MKNIIRKQPRNKRFYNSKKFKKEIEKAKKESEKLLELSKIDGDKLNRFDV